MRALRTVVSSLCILTGVLLIAAWALSSVIVDQVEDGEAVRGIADRALESPAVADALSAELSARTQEALAAQGLDLAALGLDDELDTALARAVETEAFRDTVADQVDAAHGQVTEQLTDPEREPAPLVVTVNLSDAVNARIAELGGLAVAAPDLAVPPVTIEALDAQQFEQARTAYERTAWAERWGLWLGLAALALGLLVSHRRRWFLAKALGVLGVLCLAFGGAIALLGPDTMASAMPGGEGGSLSTMWQELLTEEAAPVVMARALWIGGIALVLALVATLLGALAGGRRR